MTKKPSATLIRYVDFSAIDSSSSSDRIAQRLLGGSDDVQSCTLTYIRTPAGGGSPEGLHVHDVDQVFYIISGTMFVEINNELAELSSGSAVLIPAGVPHRNWCENTETVHLSFMAPAPKTRTRQVQHVALGG